MQRSTTKTSAVPPKLHTIAEAAAALSMGRTKLKALIAKGVIQVVRDGGWVRVPDSELDLFIRNRLT